jgi:hypothetical protein
MATAKPNETGTARSRDRTRRDDDHREAIPEPPRIGHIPCHQEAFAIQYANANTVRHPQGKESVTRVISIRPVDRGVVTM